MSDKVSKASEINLEEYAKDIVDSWDMDNLVAFAIDTIIESFKTTPEDQLVEEYNEFHGH